MAGSRIHKIGSIFERVSGLVETGVIKPVDKPIWFDIYKHHPPKYNPAFDRPTLKIAIKPILYEEDVLRAKIHNLSKKLVFDLSNDYKKSKTVLCQEIMKEGVSLNKAVERIEKKEVRVLKTKQESTIFEDLEELRNDYHNE